MFTRVVPLTGVARGDGVNWSSVNVFRYYCRRYTTFRFVASTREE